MLVMIPEYLLNWVGGWLRASQALVSFRSKAATIFFWKANPHSHISFKSCDPSWILKGANPAERSGERPVVFELALKLKTASDAVMSACRHFSNLPRLPA